MKEKKRLDVLLTELRLFPSREQARAAIMAGEVLVNNIKIDKAGAAVEPTADIRLLGKKLPYVSRGGLKLAKALTSFAVNLNGKKVLDIGASTGGFVDCALQNGAAQVYAVDVGTNQLAWSLRSDPRVVVLEKTNARTLDRSIIDDDVDVLTADVSFISLQLALPAAINHQLKPGGEIICLIKPQFEAGRDAVGKGGVVRDAAVHKRVINEIADFFSCCQAGVQALDYSPITGADGNIEYLIYAIKGAESQPLPVEKTVRDAWHEHKKNKQLSPH